MSWVPAWTPDRRHWFDGVAWRPARVSWSVRARRYLVAWLSSLFLIFVFIWALVGLGTTNVAVWVTTLSAAGGISVGSGIATGYVLARDGTGRLLPRAALAGTGVLMACYVASFIFGSGDQNADNEAGAGIAILGLPTLAATATILGLGWIAGRLTRRQRPAPASR